jgi:hypothetical protein
LIGEWNLFSVSLGIRIFILNSIGDKIILDSHWFMKDEEAIDWKEGFLNFHWTRRKSSRRGHGRFTKRRVVYCVFFPGKKEENECEKEKISSYVGKNVVHGKNVCKKKSTKGSCV